MPVLPLRRSVAAFSLVEVTLALGIVAFGLVAILAVLPIAMTTGRASIAQTRASELAETVFAGLRAEPFRAAVPGRGLEADGASLPVLDLATRQTSAGANGSVVGGLTIYVLLTESAAPGVGDPRRLRFTEKASDATAAASGTSAYRLDFSFKMDPDGLPTRTVGGTPVGIANRLLLTITPATGNTAESARFTTLIANRTGA